MAQRIMLIDDDEGYLRAVRHLLENAGYTVRSAGSAAEARRQMEAEKPDLMLLDVIMPAKDGFTFAEELAGDSEIADVPVVLVTAVADSRGQTMRAFREDHGLTAVDVLPKSEVPDRLLDCVASALGKKEGAAAEPSAG